MHSETNNCLVEQVPMDAKCSKNAKMEESPIQQSLAKTQTQILILEDDAGDALLVERALKSCNACFEFRHVETFAEALPLLKEKTFDLLLLDLSLPDSFGLQGIDRLREHSPQTPIVVLTGLDDSQLALEALERGAQDYLIKGEWTQEGLKRTLRYAIQRHLVLAENERLMEKIRRQARFDALTGVLNRHSFAAELEREWARAARSQLQLSVVMIDVDLFKSVNDNYGHAAGDEVLRLISAQIQNQCRESDLVGRYGGEEFCALLPDTAERGAVVWAERVRTSIEDLQIAVRDFSFTVTASFGVAQRQPETKSPSQLVDTADQALLIAKRCGRNRVVSQCQVEGLRSPRRARLFENLSRIRAKEIMVPLSHSLSIDSSLSDAAEYLARTGLDTAPIVDASGELAGVISEDSLIREWSSPRGWNAPVSCVMNKRPACLSLESGASNLLEFLQRSSMHEVFLLDEKRAVGYVSRINLVSYLHQHESLAGSTASESQDSILSRIGMDSAEAPSPSQSGRQ